MSQRIEYFFFQFLKSIVLSLPLKWVQGFGAFLGSASYFLVWKRREIALENLRYAFPEKSLMELKAIARRAFENYGITMLEFMWFPNFTRESLQKIVVDRDMTIFYDCFKRGKGVVAVSAHLSNWEIMALALGAESGAPLSIVVQTQANGWVDGVINANRTMFGNKIVPMGISVREIVRALQKAEVVALAADQSGPMESPYIEFFGRMTATHQGPAVFALRMGSPVILVLALRNADGTYKTIIEEIPTSDLKGYTEANVKELTQRHARALERHIRQHPDQWLWMHRRWKHSLDPENKTVIKEAYTGA